MNYIAKSPLRLFSSQGRSFLIKLFATSRLPLAHFFHRKNSQKCETLFQAFPLLHFAQRKIQQKLSAYFIGFPSGAGIARFIADCCTLFEIKIYALFQGFPLPCFCCCKIQQKLSALFQAFPLPAENFARKIFSRQKCEAFPYVKASPRGTFLAKLPLKGSFGGLLSLKATDEEKLAFLFCLKILLTNNFQTKGRSILCKPIFD